MSCALCGGAWCMGGAGGKRAVACRRCGGRGAAGFHCAQAHLRRFPPGEATCPACGARDPFPDPARVPWRRVLRRGAGFYLHCDHPRIADDACYLTAALTLSEQREHGVYAPTQVRRARPRAFSAAPPGAWAPRIMRHPALPGRITQRGLLVYVDLPRGAARWKENDKKTRSRVCALLLRHTALPIEILHTLLWTYLAVHDFDSDPTRTVRISAFGVDHEIFQVVRARAL